MIILFKSLSKSFQVPNSTTEPVILHVLIVTNLTAGMEGHPYLGDYHLTEYSI